MWDRIEPLMPADPVRGRRWANHRRMLTVKRDTPVTYGDCPAEYARALFEMQLPAYEPEAVEQAIAARVARQTIFERSPSPALSFVQEEATLRRPLGGTMVLRRQLEHLLSLSQLRQVAIQVMPTSCEEHAGMQGETQVLKFKDGTALGRSEGAFNGRAVSDPKQLRILELRYGMIRAQALTPRESLAFIEQLLGET